MWAKTALLIFIVWVIQGLLSYSQIKNFKLKLAEFKNYHRFGIGQVKGRFSRGVIVILGVDGNDIIVNAEIMSGITVFARFKPFDILKNQNINHINAITKSMNKCTRNAAIEAINSLKHTKILEKEVVESV
ncbi:MAG: transcriptional regulator [Clostridiales bacterium]|nr:transcriptional regulator [Clostridiales bacterium]